MLLRLTPVDQLGHGWRHLDVIVPSPKPVLTTAWALQPCRATWRGQDESVTRPTGVNRRSIWHDMARNLLPRGVSLAEHRSAAFLSLDLGEPTRLTPNINNCFISTQNVGAARNRPRGILPTSDSPIPTSIPGPTHTELSGRLSANQAASPPSLETRRSFAHDSRRPGKAP